MSITRVLNAGTFVNLSFGIDRSILVPEPRARVLIRAIIATTRKATPIVVSVNANDKTVILDLLRCLPRTAKANISVSSGTLTVTTRGNHSLNLSSHIA